MNRLHDLAVYFGLREPEHPAEDEPPAEGWAVALLRFVPPTFLAFVLQEPLGLDDGLAGFLLTMGLVLVLVALWTVALGAILHRREGG